MNSKGNDGDSKKAWHFFVYHLPFLVWLVTIFIFSSIPATELPHFELVNSDKLVHIGVYFLLALLCYLSIIHQNRFRILVNYPLASVLLVCSIYALTDEWHQTFVPKRSGELMDWIADVIGVILMVILIKYVLRKRYRLFRAAV